MPEDLTNCAFFITRRQDIYVVGVGQIWRRDQFFGDVRQLLSAGVPEISIRAAEMMGYYE